MKTIFITGTDTNIGKTHVTIALIKLFNDYNFKTFGIKPIASGCELNANGQWINADALALQKISSIHRPIETVNPIALPEPIAPHLAATKLSINLSVAAIYEKIINSLQADADINIIEGVGGWSVPLNQSESMADLVEKLNIPIILVVGIKLGCLNHAILTSEAIIQRKLPFIGWIANCVEPDALAQQENIETLKQWIPVPCLGIVSHHPNILANTHSINLELILERFIVI